MRLSELHIKNFRGLRALDVDKVGRVNLVVGRNSVGKTTVLEALSLWASGGAFNHWLQDFFPGAR